MDAKASSLFLVACSKTLDNTAAVALVTISTGPHSEISLVRDETRHRREILETQPRSRQKKCFDLFEKCLSYVFESFPVAAN